MSRVRVVLTVFLLFFGASAIAQRLHSPYDTNDDKGKLRSYLETDFQKIAAACKVSPLVTARVDKDKLKAGDQISVVPVTLQKDIVNFDRPIAAYFDRSPATLFSLVFLDTERRVNGSFPFFDPARILPADYAQDPVTMLPSGGSSVFYNYTCSSIINAAINLKTGITFPVATLSSAIQDQYGTDKQSVISLVEGHFKSPLNDFFGIGADAVHRNFGTLLLWEWYLANPSRTNGTAYWLSTFDGVSLYRSSVAKRSNSGSASFSATANYAVLSTEAALKASLGTSESFRVEEYRTYPYTDPAPSSEWGHFEQIAKIMDIVQMFAGMRTTEEQFNGIIVQGSKTPYLISQDLDGVPASLCKPGAWAARDTNSTHLYDIFMSNVTPFGSTGCRFTVSFSPRPAFFSTSAPPLEYANVFVPPVGSGLPELVIPATPMNLNTTVSPDIHLMTYDRVASSTKSKNAAGNDVNVMSWKVKLQVNDKDDLVDAGAPIDTTGGVNPNSAVTVKCANYNPGFDLPSATYQATGPRVVELTLSRSIGSYDPEDVNGSLIDCNIGGTLGFTMASPAGGSRVVYKALPALPIKYPALKQAQNPNAVNSKPSEDPQPTSPQVMPSK
jgi:hypothetical protein